MTNATGEFTPEYIRYVLILSAYATGGLVIMWLIFWSSAAYTGQNVREILLSSGFFRTVVVMGVIAATVVLSLANRLEGNVSAAILSGIVGYVLGHLSGRRTPHEPDER